MTTRKWGGRKAMKARAYIATTLPAPCSKCSRPVLPGQAWDVDHLTPRYLGGSDELTNLAACHRLCNRAAGSRAGTRIKAARRQGQRIETQTWDW